MVQNLNNEIIKEIQCFNQNLILYMANIFNLGFISHINIDQQTYMGTKFLNTCTMNVR